MASCFFAQNKNLKKRQTIAKIFRRVCRSMSYLLVVLVCYLLWEVIYDGWKWLSFDFLTNFSSRFVHKSGLVAALTGSVWLIIITIVISVPVGIASATFLEELMPDNKLKSFISLNIQNLAGVPSIVYGILGLAVFVRTFGFGNSLLSGGLTLAMLVMPIIIIATRESLRSVPKTIRLAALALGATRWQTVRCFVLPSSIGGILTGIILSISRAMGETAPLILVGAVAYIRYTPESIMDSYTALPIQIYNWVGKPKTEFHQLAAAGIIVLLSVMLITNLLAIIIRHRKQRINI